MGLVAVELLASCEVANYTVNTGVDISLAEERVEKFAVVSLALSHYGSKECDFATFVVAEYQIGNLLVRVVCHLLAGYGRIGARSSSEEKSHEISDFGYCADG